MAEFELDSIFLTADYKIVVCNYTCNRAGGDTEMMVWAFNQVDNGDWRSIVYQSMKEGKSRFGWSWDEMHNLTLQNNWTDEHSKQLFLLQIEKGDWIVHINTPEWGMCIAGEVRSKYNFDEGLECDGSCDFRHNFEIDTNSIIEFNRNNPNVLPSVNLKPRGRYHRVYAIDDFLRSVENLNDDVIRLKENENKEEHHLRKITEKYLKEITLDIHKTHRGKHLERFLAETIRKIPGVVDVQENGSGWGTDYGADLIVTLRSVMGQFDFEHKIIVQVKSYKGPHYDLEAVEQIKIGIEKFKGTAGLLVTTGDRTEQLEKRISELSSEIESPIYLLCGEDVARFVIQSAPQLLFNGNFG